MKKVILLSVLSVVCVFSIADAKHQYNKNYTGANLDRVAFPIGGIGAGMVCLDGNGSISHVSVRNTMEFFHSPCSFAAIYVNNGKNKVAKVLEGQVPGWRVFGPSNAGNGSPGSSLGLPRFDSAEFLTRFPFATIKLEDKLVPIDVEITGWSPFIPTDSDNSSLPAGALEYKFKNNTNKTIEAVFSYNSKNFMSKGKGNSIKAIRNGFMLSQQGSQDRPYDQGDFAIFVDDDDVVVDHCWFIGGWWDSLSIAWDNIENGKLVSNPPTTKAAPGASLFVPMKLLPNQEKTVRLMFAWYVPKTNLRIGGDQKATGPAFKHGPSKSAAPNQTSVTGFIGKGFINTFDPSGDGLVGTLTSPEFKLTHRYIQFLIGGGDHKGKTCLNLLVDGKAVITETANNNEHLTWQKWDAKEYRGKNIQIQIVDNETGGWGHINIDQIVMTNKPIADPYKFNFENFDGKVINNFEGRDFGNWVVLENCDTEICSDESASCAQTYDVPWYACHFKSTSKIIEYWRENYQTLRDKSKLFADTFYDTTLPPEVVEAVAANLTIIKSPTVRRQADGKLWCWEGCSDGSGCCHGSCTHVWNYAQAIQHLFGDLEQSLRDTEFNEAQSDIGCQAFRVNLPIRDTKRNSGAAADGQLGGIMKVYRQWRTTADGKWLKNIWPKVRQSLDYCIETWDPRHTGLLEEPQHNTYDINYWGPNGHCSSFYLGALKAAIEIGNHFGDDVTLYEQLLEKGKRRLVAELWNGEYFYHKIQTEGLNAKFNPISASNNGSGYSDLVKQLNNSGPKYQYGTGCLSDGVIGFWMAKMCGLGEIIDSEKVATNLKSIYKYNFKKDLSNHGNPQRPSFALGHEGGLLLCTWPKGGKLLLPFVYSNEVWTGIEYQVASHLMLEGMVDEGLEIVRACRDRYDGKIRNPFNEYECGHWYARAMSSYGMIAGLTGVRYDAVEKTMYIDSQVGKNFKSFLSTATGFGSVGLKNGKPFAEIKLGNIQIDRYNVSGKIIYN
ncbi:MAG: hypothetical protein KAS96_05530 [Planctomycetes bacterium]|nr:hypothetical protein [Planctomycetota bacterium]